MAEARPVELQIIGASLDDIKATLGVGGDLREGARVPLPGGATLEVEEVSKSSGFDATTVILTAIVSVATSTATAVLTDWLKAQLLKSEPSSDITIVVNGQQIEVKRGS